jgi:hypothetical protein
MTGFLRLPDPGRGARGDHVAGEQGHDGGHPGHHVLHGKNEALGVADLAQLAVDPRLDLGGIGIEVGGDARPDGAEGVKSLGAGLLVIVLLDVPGREVVEAGVAEHVLARALGRGVPAALANDDGQLALVVHPGGLGRIDDGIVGPAQGGEGLEEEQRLVGDGQMHLLGVLAVVEGEGHDLGGDHGSEEDRLLHRPPLAPSLERAVGRAGILDDLGAVEDTVARLARRLESHDLHGVRPRTSCIE